MPYALTLVLTLSICISQLAIDDALARHTDLRLQLTQQRQAQSVGQSGSQSSPGTKDNPNRGATGSSTAVRGRDTEPTDADTDADTVTTDSLLHASDVVRLQVWCVVV